jgi:uncharacterized protein YutE (UPF0331/DUF86 family)
MVYKDTIYKYLENLEESLRRIAEMDLTLEVILEDEDVQDLLDRRMQKAIEATIDIAAHLVAIQKLGQTENSAELFFLLAKKEIIDKDLSERLTKAVGFRNIIVHEYTAIDYKLAYSNLDEKLKDLREFALAIKHYLEIQD